MKEEKIGWGIAVYPQRQKVLCALLVILLLSVSWSGFVDRSAKDYVDGTIGQAAAVFVIARGLNAFLTTAKSTELSLGVVSFQPLEVLDPIHDLVEHFSSLMKLSIVSLLIQKFLIEIFSTTAFKSALTVFSVVFLVSFFFARNNFTNWAWKVLLMAATLRFLFVGLVLLNGMVDEAFSRSATESKKTEVQILAVELERASRTNLPSEEESAHLREEATTLEERVSEIVAFRVDAEEKREASQARVEQVEAEIENSPRRWFWRRMISEEQRAERDTARKELRAKQEEVRLLDRDYEIVMQRLSQIQSRLDGGDEQGLLGGLVSRVRTVADLVRVTTLQERAEQLIDGILALMALFFMRTVLFPLIFLYFLVRVSKFLWRIDLMTVLRKAPEYLRDEIAGSRPA